MDTYLLKSSLALLVLYLAYRFITVNQRNFQMQRILALACVVFSATYGLITLPNPFMDTTPSQTYYVMVSLSNHILDSFSTPESSEFNTTPNLVFWIYLVGVTAVFIRFVFGIFTLWKYWKQSIRHKKNGFIVANINAKITPFTFLNFLFINPNNLTEEELEIVYLHEGIHRKHGHVFDNLFMELMCILFWFHPMIWLFKKHIRESHEYMADEYVIHQGVDSLEYQLLLFKFQTGVEMPLVSQFNNGISLNKRINRMKKLNLKNAKKLSWKLWLVIPVMLVLMVISCTEKFPLESSVKQAEYESGEDELYSYVGRNISYPKASRMLGATGVVNVIFEVNEHGQVQNPRVGTPEGTLLQKIIVIGYDSNHGSNDKTIIQNDITSDENLENEVVKMVNSLGKFIPAKKYGKSVSSIMTLPVQFNLR